MIKKSNKKIILRFRAMNKDFFAAIKAGKKKIETRAATVKYRDIKIGDRIEFVCGKERFRRTVESAAIFRSINDMLKKHKVTDIMPNAESTKDLQKLYNSFASYREKLQKFGVITLEFKK